MNLSIPPVSKTANLLNVRLQNRTIILRQSYVKRGLRSRTNIRHDRSGRIVLLW